MNNNAHESVAKIVGLSDTYEFSRRRDNASLVTAVSGDNRHRLILISRPGLVSECLGRMLAARAAVAELAIPHAHSRTSTHITISGGVSVLLRRIDSTAEQLIAAADQTLFQAKHLGRNRMIAIQSEPG